MPTPRMDAVAVPGGHCTYQEAVGMVTRASLVRGGTAWPSPRDAFGQVTERLRAGSHRHCRICEVWATGDAIRTTYTRPSVSLQCFHFQCGNAIRDDSEICECHAGVRHR